MPLSSSASPKSPVYIFITAASFPSKPVWLRGKASMLDTKIGRFDYQQFGIGGMLFAMLTGMCCLIFSVIPPAIDVII